MSFFATVQGGLTFQNESDFRTAINELSKRGWLEDGYLIDSSGSPANPDTPNILEDSLTIIIPLGLYKNLTYLLINDSFKKAKSSIYWTSTDDCFQGGVITNGVEQVYDLDKWAQDVLLIDRVKIEDGLDAYNEYTDMVEEEFHACI